MKYETTKTNMIREINKYSMLHLIHNKISNQCPFKFETLMIKFYYKYKFNIIILYYQ